MTECLFLFWGELSFKSMSSDPAMGHNCKRFEVQRQVQTSFIHAANPQSWLLQSKRYRCWSSRTVSTLMGDSCSCPQEAALLRCGLCYSCVPHHKHDRNERGILFQTLVWTIVQVITVQCPLLNLECICFIFCFIKYISYVSLSSWPLYPLLCFEKLPHIVVFRC